MQAVKHCFSKIIQLLPTVLANSIMAGPKTIVVVVVVLVLCLKKVKASHTRHRALGPELIPVYRQSACR